MTSRVWIGGGTNNIYDGSDWSPAGTPQPGDMLSMYSGTANMAGGDLAGDTLSVGTQTSFGSSTPAAVVNLTDRAVLTAAAATTAFSDQNIVFNASGIDTLNLTIGNNYYATMNTAVNIGALSMLRGTVAVGGHNGNLTMDGGVLSAFDNDGASSVGDNCVTTINADVVGVGSFAVSSEARLSFLHAVGPAQSVSMLGEDSLFIGDPHGFLGQTDVAGTAPSFSIELAGIINAGSYSYADDMLALFHGNRPIDVLRLSDTGSFQVAENASGVFIGSGSGIPPDAVLLPQHNAGIAGVLSAL